MNKNLLFFMVVFIISLLKIHAQVPNNVPTNGLVGWWPFNGNANDESGNGNNGTVNGATLTTDRFGTVSKAYSFNGLDQWIEVPDNPSLDITQEVTISAWVYKPQFNQRYEAVVIKDFNGTNTQLINYKFQIDELNGMNFYTSRGYSTGNFNTTNWHYFVGVCTMDSIKVYVDNSLVWNTSNGFNTNYLANNNLPLTFGRLPYDEPISVGNERMYFDGILDVIGIWNRALTPQEISNLYNSGPFEATANNLSICEGQTATLSVNALSGTVSSLSCGSSTNNGILVSGMPVSSASSVISYTGGNGGIYTGQTVNSTGVTGLTATLTEGAFASGDGTLTYTITGTPSASGTASFALNIGGQTCTFTRTVEALSVMYPSGSTFCASGPSSIVDVTNPTTGKVWMDRNLGATQVATSSTDANSYGDLYQWGRRSDGHQCRNSTVTSTLSSTDQPADGKFILVNATPNDWRSPQNNNLWQGVSGTNNPCPLGYRLPTETELNEERLTWSTQNSSGAYASPLKWTMAGRRNYSNGTLSTVGTNGYYWTSTILTTFTRSLSYTASSYTWNSQLRGYGISVRCIKEVVGTIGAIDYGTATNTSNLVVNTAASGVSSSVPYTGGNAGVHAGQTVTSTGVSGLTATLSPGSFANGAGNLTYTITGTPTTSGTASFALNIGGKTCTLNVIVYGPQPNYAAGTVHCNSIVTIVNDVTNPTTGKTWMDRNLGASRVATSSTDVAAYGDLYQWGRGADGHQCRNSATTATLSSTDQPGHGNFILAPNSPGDWRNPQNTNLWQGVNGVNNPCPSGYRLPTETELNTERLSWNSYNSFGAYTSPLKLPMTGDRGGGSASLSAVGTGGYYWSQTISSTASLYLLFYSTDAFTLAISRSFGISVRCIKD